jgi:hypothetical protein
MQRLFEGDAGSGGKDVPNRTAFDFDGENEFGRHWETEPK